MDERAPATSQFPVRCEVCKRQDHTVRFVTYPYVFSFIVVTFQQSFSGCWCRVHRIQRWFAASLISAIFGWFGIPFGIVFTPVRLIQLARGGIMDGNLNSQILRVIGDEKLNGRDTAGAIRCFEASLMYADDPEVREKLQNLYRTQRTLDVSTPSALTAVLAFSAIPAVFFIVGLIVGLIDNFLAWYSSSIFQEYSIYILILLQVPLVISIYFGVAALAYFLRSMIRSAGITSSPLFAVAASVFSFLFLYSIVVGETLAVYLQYMINGFWEPLEDTLATLAAISTHAAFYMFSAESFTTNTTGTALYAALLTLSFVFALAVSLPTLKENIRQQSRLQSILQSTEHMGTGYSIGGWISVLGLLMAVALLYFTTPQKAHVDTLDAFNHLTKGYFQLTSNQPEQAVLEYQKAIELKPDFALAHIVLANFYLSAGEQDKAWASFQRAGELEPNNPTVHSGFGWVYLQQAKYGLAKLEFEKALQLEPQSLDGHLGLGWVYLNEEEFQKSRSEFETVINVAPEIVDAHLGLGIVHYIGSNFDGALESIDSALKINPNYPEALFYKGRIYYSEERYEDANELFLAVLKLQPEHYGALTGLGEIQMSKYDFDEGLRYLDQAHEIDPSRVDAPLDIASIRIQRGEIDQAIDVIADYVEVESSVKPILSYFQYRKGMNDEGDRLLQESITSLNELTGMRQQRTSVAIAAVYSSVNDFPAALQYIELADSQPAHLDANSYLLYVQILSSMGDFDKAEKILQTVKGMGHSEYSLHLARAQVLIDQEKLDEALKETSMAMDIDSRSSRAHVGMAYILFLQGDLEGSLEEAKTANEINPYNADAHATMAFVYQAMGRTDEALAEAQEAVRLDSLKNTSHYILGVCYMEKGMNAEAAAEFETFLDSYWDRSYVREYKVKAEEYLVQLKSTP